MADGKSKEVFEAFQGLPAFAKAAIVLVGLGIVVGVPYGIYTYVKNVAANKKAMQTINQAQQDEASLSAGGIKPSYLQTQYQTWANEIMVAINDCQQDHDTMKQTILGIFGNMQNVADVLQVITAFGIKTATPCWQDVTYLLCNISMEVSSKSWTGDLSWWLEQAFNNDSDGFTQINNLLQQKGINYTFK